VRGGPEALAGAKRLLLRRPADTIRDDLAELSALSLEFFRSSEGMEGVRALREKRAPAWLPED
jgi:methylglutaconyl-CoA hydratase